eukprot:8361437-Alexandrium_andersonii.AAC.1
MHCESCGVAAPAAGARGSALGAASATCGALRGGCDPCSAGGSGRGAVPRSVRRAPTAGHPPPSSPQP